MPSAGTMANPHGRLCWPHEPLEALRRRDRQCFHSELLVIHPSPFLRPFYHLNICQLKILVIWVPALITSFSGQSPARLTLLGLNSPTWSGLSQQAATPQLGREVAGW